MSRELELRPVLREHWGRIKNLDVRADQQSFVAPNVGSIAQASFYESWEIFGAWVGDDPVGFCLWGLDEDADELDAGAWWIVRLMIDARYQGHGYGRALTLAAMEALKAKPGCTAIYLGCVLANVNAETLYRSVGFEETGEVEDGERIFVHRVAS